MTENDFHNLDLRKIYEFKFYHGRKAVGILSQTDKEYYIIPQSSLRNHGGLITSFDEVKQLGTVVNIETIANWSVSSIQSATVQSDHLSFTGDHRATKLVILGAGASHDFSSDLNDGNLKPPLSNNLFNHWNKERIITNYPGAFNLSSSIRSTNDIEEFFEKKWKYIETNNDRITLAKIINVQYYLHELFMKISGWSQQIEMNNFDILNNALHEYSIHENEIIPIVSFNYDLFTEFSLMSSLGYGFNSMDDYVDYRKRKILLFKPHGSCNWVRYFNQGFIPDNPNADMRYVNLVANSLYSQKLSYPEILENLSEEIVVKNSWGIDATDMTSTQQYYPQLLIPFKSKDEFVMPTKHQQVLDYILSDVKEILIIGWKGTEETFNSLLGQKLSGKKIHVTIVNGPNESGQQTFDHLFKYLHSSVPNIVQETFSSFSKKIANGMSPFFQ